MQDKEIFSALNKKLDKKLFIAIVTVIVGAIGNLYVMYYSGIADLKTDVKLIKQDVEYLRRDFQRLEIVE